MDKYSLSVIVPVYNAEHTISRCLESILNQTYKKFELILVDDGSTDQSSALCDSYAQRDNRITVIHTNNAGPFQARKLGVKRAAVELLAFSDADDWLDGNAFETAMQIFCKHNPDILAYTYEYEDGKAEKHLYEEKLYDGSEIRSNIIPGMMFDSALGRRRLDPSLCCKVMKKNIYTEVTESIEDRITLGEDALVTYPAVCLAESIFICNKGLYHYCNNSDSCTHTYPLERIAEVRAFQANIMRLFSQMGVLDVLRHQVEDYVRLFLAMMVESWYGITLSPISYSFPYDMIPKNSRVFVYGAGNVGKSYINELQITNYAEIAGWADRRYGEIKSYHNINIVPPEQIMQREFDILLIAIWNKEDADMIREEMAEQGIPEEKIVWARPVRIV